MLKGGPSRCLATYLNFMTFVFVQVHTARPKLMNYKCHMTVLGTEGMLPLSSLISPSLVLTPQETVPTEIPLDTLEHCTILMPIRLIPVISFHSM